MPTSVLTNNATKLALSTPQEIDLVLLVGEVADTKTNVGITLRGKHGDQNLFSGVCKYVKSCLSMERTAKLPDDIVEKIKAAIAEYWKKQFSKVLGYGEVQSITFDKPSATFEANAVSGIYKNARIHVQAPVEDGKERQFFALTLLNNAKRQLARMHDQPGRYDRNHMAKCENKIAALEHEYKRLVEFNTPQASS